MSAQPSTWREARAHRCASLAAIGVYEYRCTSLFWARQRMRDGLRCWSSMDGILFVDDGRDPIAFAPTETGGRQLWQCVR